jgi:hypothetical protein
MRFAASRSGAVTKRLLTSIVHGPSAPSWKACPTWTDNLKIDPRKSIRLRVSKAQEASRTSPGTLISHQNGQMSSSREGPPLFSPPSWGDHKPRVGLAPRGMRSSLPDGALPAKEAPRPAVPTAGTARAPTRRGSGQDRLPAAIYPRSHRCKRRFKLGL